MFLVKAKAWMVDRQADSVHRSTAELEADAAVFIGAQKDKPKPYKWVNPLTTSSPRFGVSARKQ